MKERLIPVLFLLTLAGCAANHAELTTLYDQDQASRRSFHALDEEQARALIAADRDRRRRAVDLYRAGALRTGADHYHAAMVLQHGEKPEDFLLAHELAVAALALGERRGAWLAAATEDRFLLAIGKEQRFATQFRKADPGAPWELSPLDENGVTDGLRRALDCPTLAEARRRVGALNEPGSR